MSHFELFFERSLKDKSPSSLKQMKAQQHVSDNNTHIIQVTTEATLLSTAPEDFTSRTGVQVVFAPGEQEQTVEVTTIGDTRYETDEEFFALLSLPTNSQGVVLGSQDTATATIVDDDRKLLQTLSNKQLLLIRFKHDYETEIIIGFEQATYDFVEPSFSTVSQMICIQLRSGSLSSDLLIQPEWTQDTALGI